jgi:hypothetical protein
MSNYRRSIPCFVAFFVIFGLITGCAPNNGGTGPDNTEKIDNTTTTVGYDGEAEIGENSAEIEIPAFDFLQGGVSYEVDHTNSVELFVDANATQEQILSLEADDGLVWTLTVPPNAVAESVLIKISALVNIESDALGSLKTGVLLEPDGLEFSSPVTLQITGEGLGVHPIIFRGSHDGTEVDFANITLIEGGVSAAITHFSSAFADPLTDETKYTKAQGAARDGYKKIRDFALSFLKEKIYAPQPPAIPLRCAANQETEAQREQALKVFLEEFSMPEEAIIRMLLEAGRNDAIINNADNDGIEIARLLLERLMKKGNMLYKAYYPNEEYFLAITRAGLSADRQLQLMGGSPDGESFIAKTGRWARQIADSQLKAFREQHDYQLLTTMIEMDREASMLGNSKDNSLGEIEKAVQFELQYDVQVTFDIDVGEETVSTRGTASFNGMHFGKEDYYESGKGGYVGFEATLPDPFTASLNMPASYQFDARIENFDPCEKFSFDLILNKFSDYTETYTYSDGEFQTTQTEGFVSATMYSAFENEVVETLPGREGEAFFKFTIPLQNLNPTTGEMEITREIPNCTAILKLKVVHAPK